MKDHIYKNIGILAHVDAGKTTLTEQMLFAAGSIRSAGRVDSGTAQTDFMTIERERGISVRSSTASIETKTSDGIPCTINIIDTPGHVDFAGEVERSLGALDFGVLIISAAEGVQSHTENIYRALDEFELPRMIFINKIDRAGADTAAVIESLPKIMGGKYVALTATSSEGSRECGAKMLDESSILAQITEALADVYDDIADMFLMDEKIPADVILARFADAVRECKITPVLCGSALNGIGVSDLIEFITEYMPSSDSRATDELSALVFKLDHDKVMGKIAHVRMFGGSIKNRDTVKIAPLPSDKTDDDVRNDNVRGDDDDEKPKQKDEKVTQIRKFTGAKYTDAGEVASGEIAALCGLSTVKTGTWLGMCSVPEKYLLANPFLCVKVTPADAQKLPELVAAVGELADEEPYINYRWESGEREINIDLTGEIQLEVISELLKERYNLDTAFSPPSVIYKETPTQFGIGFDAYTMPKPCWAVVKLGIEPLPRGSGVVYEVMKIPHNKLFYKYQTHIKKSLFMSLGQGLHGWELTDMKVTLLDGEHHTIHTHPLDFFVATPMAFMNGLTCTGTTLLEPLIKARITAPTEFMGKIVSDIIMMKGEFDTPVHNEISCTIECILPVARAMEYGYPVKLSSMTSGRAIYAPTFHGYRDCPLSEGKTTPYRGINPLDRAKYILHVRGAL